MKIRQVFLIVIISSVSSVSSVVLSYRLFRHSDILITQAESSPTVHYAKFSDGNHGVSEPIDFTKAALISTPAVVHIKTKTPAKKISSNHNDTDNFLNHVFGVDLGATPEQRESGSGVIISRDGYIITNNHVISDEDGGIASDINVTVYNGKIYKAKLIGRDANADIAVLKIEAADLPYLVCGNSDELQTGQWVLAVGYPLSLGTTVTAGIISATGRGIETNSREVKNGETAFRSFIQTDAAMNIGSSGGALVNIDGALIGINSTIISPTGTYAGYSFSIPINTVKKAVKNIIHSASVPGALQ
jgi:serine protease Do